VNVKSGENTRDREFWIREVTWMVKNYYFIFTTVYYDIRDPGRNDKLLAKIDIDRALNSGCRTIEEIVDFLGMEEEGWFYGIR